MCGICGIIGPVCQNPESAHLLAGMMRLLAHRGPDGEGSHGDEQHLFGHRRLAIIDLEHGKQPMLSQDGNLVLIFNGEIYNYLELRQTLLRNGHSFTTFSDTEVLLKVLEVYGMAGLSKLNGMFAFALYNKKEKKLLLARDPFGIKPLYYTVTPSGTFLFASEIKSLFQHPEVVPRLDQNALFEYLTFQFCLGDKTLFAGIYKLLPAHTLQWRHGWDQPRMQRYWETDYTLDESRTRDYYSDRLLLLLQDSVRQQLVSDVPLGCYLSGGMDSGVVTTLATLQHGEGMHAFHGRFAEGPAYDESAYAKEVAGQNGCILHEVVPTVQNFMDLLPRLIYHMDEPTAGPGLLPQYLVSKMARQHVTVVLSGVGGDELFGGYARYLVAYLEQCIKGAIFETQEEGQHITTLQSIIPNLPLLQQYVPMLQSFWKAELFAPMDRRYFRLIDRCHELNALLHPDWRARFNQEAIFAEFQSLFQASRTASFLNKMTAFDQQTLLPALLQVEDRVSMAVSLESRVPLLDVRVATLAAGIPPHVKYRNGELKSIFRHAVRNLLPASVLDRKDKMGFPMPFKEWWRAGPLKEYTLDILLSDTCRDRGIFDQKALTRVLNDKDYIFGRQTWGALNLELWFRQFFDGEATHGGIV
ncbi:MAG: asparagine synthase (glutamine-hydrolyzing) [Magnetococcales bacterium]|nr:asparagine synthase (glutamine-hydrolyzing) [Magnetococcales bacterium]